MNYINNFIISFIFNISYSLKEIDVSRYIKTSFSFIYFINLSEILF